MPIVAAAVPSAEETRTLHDRYEAVWIARDLDEIVAMHADQGVVYSHARGEVEYAGIDAIREYWRTTLDTWSTLDFEVVRLHVAPGLIASEMVMRGSLARPIDGPSGVIPGDGRHFCVDAAEIMTWQHGKLTRKDTYYDTATLLAQLVAGGVAQ